MNLTLRKSVPNVTWQTNVQSVRLVPYRRFLYWGGRWWNIIIFCKSNTYATVMYVLICVIILILVICCFFLDSKSLSNDFLLYSYHLYRFKIVFTIWDNLKIIEKRYYKNNKIVKNHKHVFNWFLLQEKNAGYCNENILKKN